MFWQGFSSRWRCVGPRLRALGLDKDVRVFRRSLCLDEEIIPLGRRQSDRPRLLGRERLGTFDNFLLELGRLYLFLCFF